MKKLIISILLICSVLFFTLQNSPTNSVKVKADSSTDYSIWFESREGGYPYDPAQYVGTNYYGAPPVSETTYNGQQKVYKNADNPVAGFADPDVYWVDIKIKVPEAYSMYSLDIQIKYDKTNLDYLWGKDNNVSLKNFEIYNNSQGYKDSLASFYTQYDKLLGYKMDQQTAWGIAINSIKMTTEDGNGADAWSAKDADSDDGVVRMTLFITSKTGDYYGYSGEFIYASLPFKLRAGSTSGSVEFLQQPEDVFGMNDDVSKGHKPAQYGANVTIPGAQNSTVEVPAGNLHIGSTTLNTNALSLNGTDTTLPTVEYTDGVLSQTITEAAPNPDGSTIESVTVDGVPISEPYDIALANASDSATVVITYVSEDGTVHSTVKFDVVGLERYRLDSVHFSNEEGDGYVVDDIAFDQNTRSDTLKVSGSLKTLTVKFEATEADNINQVQLIYSDAGANTTLAKYTNAQLYSGGVKQLITGTLKRSFDAGDKVILRVFREGSTVDYEDYTYTISTISSDTTYAEQFYDQNGGAVYAVHDYSYISSNATLEVYSSVRYTCNATDPNATVEIVSYSINGGAATVVNEIGTNPSFSEYTVPFGSSLDEVNVTFNVKVSAEDGSSVTFSTIITRSAASSDVSFSDVNTYNTVQTADKASVSFSSITTPTALTENKTAQGVAYSISGEYVEAVHMIFTTGYLHQTARAYVSAVTLNGAPKTISGPSTIGNAAYSIDFAQSFGPNTNKAQQILVVEITLIPEYNDGSKNKTITYTFTKLAASNDKSVGDTSVTGVQDDAQTFTGALTDSGSAETFTAKYSSNISANGAIVTSFEFLITPNHPNATAQAVSLQKIKGGVSQGDVLSSATSSDVNRPVDQSNQRKVVINVPSADYAEVEYVLTYSITSEDGTTAAVSKTLNAIRQEASTDTNVAVDSAKYNTDVTPSKGNIVFTQTADSASAHAENSNILPFSDAGEYLESVTIQLTAEHINAVIYVSAIDYAYTTNFSSSDDSGALNTMSASNILFESYTTNKASEILVISFTVTPENKDAQQKVYSYTINKGPASANVDLDNPVINGIDKNNNTKSANDPGDPFNAVQLKYSNNSDSSILNRLEFIISPTHPNAVADLVEFRSNGVVVSVGSNLVKTTDTTPRSQSDNLHLTYTMLDSYKDEINITLTFKITAEDGTTEKVDYVVTASRAMANDSTDLDAANFALNDVTHNSTISSTYDNASATFTANNSQPFSVKDTNVHIKPDFVNEKVELVKVSKTISSGSMVDDNVSIVSNSSIGSTLITNDASFDDDSSWAGRTSWNTWKTTVVYEFLVTSEYGSTKTYYVYVTRVEAAHDADSALTLQYTNGAGQSNYFYGSSSAGELAVDGTTYTGTQSVYSSTELTEFNLKIALSDPNGHIYLDSVVEVNSASVPVNTTIHSGLNQDLTSSDNTNMQEDLSVRSNEYYFELTFKIFAEDGNTSKTYVVQINREAMKVDANIYSAFLVKEDDFATDPLPSTTSRINFQSTGATTYGCTVDSKVNYIVFIAVDKDAKNVIVDSGAIITGEVTIVGADPNYKYFRTSMVITSKDFDPKLINNTLNINAQVQSESYSSSDPATYEDYTLSLNTVDNRQTTYNMDSAVVQYKDLRQPTVTWVDIYTETSFDANFTYSKTINLPWYAGDIRVIFTPASDSDRASVYSTVTATPSSELTLISGTTQRRDDILEIPQGSSITKNYYAVSESGVINTNEMKFVINRAQASQENDLLQVKIGATTVSLDPTNNVIYYNAALGVGNTIVTNVSVSTDATYTFDASTTHHTNGETPVPFAQKQTNDNVITEFRINVYAQDSLNSPNPNTYIIKVVPASNEADISNISMFEDSQFITPITKNTDDATGNPYAFDVATTAYNLTVGPLVSNVYLNISSSLNSVKTFTGGPSISQGQTVTFSAKVNSAYYDIISKDSLYTPGAEEAHGLAKAAQSSTYTFNILRSTASTDNTIAELSVYFAQTQDPTATIVELEPTSDVNTSYDNRNHTYKIFNVDENESFIWIYCVPNDAAATTSGTARSVAISLDAVTSPSYSVDFSVIAEDGTVQQYSIVLNTVSYTQNTNSNIDHILLGTAADLNPDLTVGILAFSQTTYKYDDTNFTRALTGRDDTVYLQISPEANEATIMLDMGDGAGYAEFDFTKTKTIALTAGQTKTILVKCVAENGSESSVYTIVLDRPVPSTDAHLDYIKVSDSLNNYLDKAGQIVFDSNKFSYVVNVKNTVDKLNIDAVPVDANTLVNSASSVSMVDEPIALGENLYTFNCEAEDGTTLTYTLKIVRDQSTLLSSLELYDNVGNTYYPFANTAFTSDNFGVYNATIPFVITDIRLDYTTVFVPDGTNNDDIKVKIVHNGTEYASNVIKSLPTGDNTIEVVITPKSGDANATTYTLKVTRTPGNTNAYLDTILFDGSTLNCIDGTLDYYTIVDRSTTGFTELVATPKADTTTITYPATMTLTRYAENKLLINTVAEDGVTKLTYTLHVFCASTDNSLSNIELLAKAGGAELTNSDGQAYFTFDKDVYNNLVVNIPYNISTIYVKATPTFVAAGFDNASTLYLMTIDEGQTTLTITCKSEAEMLGYPNNGDITPAKSYTIPINRAAADTNNNLATLVIEDEDGNPIALNPVFDPSITDYTVKMPDRAVSYFISTTLEAPNTATKSVSDGSYSFPTPLDASYIHTVRVTVTAEDGTQKIYTLSFTTNNISLEDNNTILQIIIKSNNKVYYDSNNSKLDPDNIVAVELDPSASYYEVNVIRPDGVSSKVMYNGNIDAADIGFTKSIAAGVTQALEVVCVSQNGSISDKAYDFSITRREADTNNYLAKIEIDGVLIQDFDAYDSITSFDGHTDFVFDLYVENSVTSLIIKGTAEASTSTVTGNTVKQLNEGINPHTIYVISEAGISREYNLRIHRAYPTPLLDNLGVNGYGFTQDNYKGSAVFDPLVNDYYCIVDNKDDIVDIIASSDDGIVTGVGSKSLPVVGPISDLTNYNLITVTVTSPQNVKNEYRIYIKRKVKSSTNTEILTLECAEIPQIEKDWNNEQTEYYADDEAKESYKVDYSVTSLDFDITLVEMVDANGDIAKIEYFGDDNLKVGENKVIAVITAPDGVTKKTLIFNVYREKPSWDVDQSAYNDIKCSELDAPSMGIVREFNLELGDKELVDVDFKKYIINDDDLTLEVIGTTKEDSDEILVSLTDDSGNVQVVKFNLNRPDNTSWWSRISTNMYIVIGVGLTLLFIILTGINSYNDKYVKITNKQRKKINKKNNE